MNSITTFGQIILGITLGSFVLVGISAILSRILFKIASRNTYRRLTTTLLVIVGSMVGTALITGSQIINDSFNYTAEVALEETLGEVDLEITTIAQSTVTDEKYAEIDALLNEQVEEYEGSVLLSVSSASIQKVEDDTPGPIKGAVSAISGEWDELNRFITRESNYQVEAPLEDEVYITETLSTATGLEAGDVVRVTVSGEFIDLRIGQVYTSKGISGYFTTSDTNTMIVNESVLRNLAPQAINNTILISSTKNSVQVSEDYDAKEFTQEVTDAIGGLTDFESYSINERKQLYQDTVSGNGTGLIFTAMSIFGIFAGILLIVNIFLMLAQERKSEMGILRAISLRRSDLIKTYLYEGIIYAVASSLLGALIGIGLGYFLIMAISAVLNSFLSSFGVDATIEFAISPTSLVISFCAGYLITMITTAISSSSISKVNIVSAIRGTEEEYNPSKFRIIVKYIFTTLFLIQGVVMFLIADNVQKQIEDSGVNTSVDGYLKYIGAVIAVITSSVIISAFAKRFMHRHYHEKINRIAHTAVSIFIFAYSTYAISADAFKETVQSSPGFFFIIGLGLVSASTLFISFNINLIIHVAKYALMPLRRTYASVKMALEYPAASPGRTGLTLAMFGLILFIIVFVSIYRTSLDDLLSRSTAGILGGADGLLVVNDVKKSDELLELIAKQEYIDNAAIGYTFNGKLPDVEPDPDAQQQGGFVLEGNNGTGYSDTFFILNEENIELLELEIGSMPEGVSEDEFFDIFIEDDSKIILGAIYDFGIPGIPTFEIGDKVKIAYPDGSESTKEVFGFLSGDFGPSLPYGNIFISQKAVESDGTYMPTVEGSRNQILFNFDDAIEPGEQSSNLKDKLALQSEFEILIAQEVLLQFQAFINQFIYILQGFLSFGLLVGLAGLAVIMTRSVNERKQQIGMLRSLGFRRSMIMSTLIIESTLIGVLGICVGVFAGSIGGMKLIESSTQDLENFTVIYPTAEIALIALGVYLMTLLFVITPAIQASRLSPVEATQYAE